MRGRKAKALRRLAFIALTEQNLPEKFKDEATDRLYALSKRAFRGKPLPHHFYYPPPMFRMDKKARQEAGYAQLSRSLVDHIRGILQ
jgi:hypothetical protein